MLGDGLSVIGTLRRNEGGMRRALIVGCRSPRTRENARLRERSRRPGRTSDRIAHVRFRTEAVLDGPQAGIGRCEQSRRGRGRAPLLGAMVAQADTGEVISYRSVVARVPSVAGGSQGAWRRTGAGRGDGGDGSSRGRPRRMSTDGPTRAPGSNGGRRTRWRARTSRRRRGKRVRRTGSPDLFAGRSRGSGYGVDMPCRGLLTTAIGCDRATGRIRTMATGSVRNSRRLRGLYRSWLRVATNTVLPSAACGRRGGRGGEVFVEAAIPERAKAGRSRIRSASGAARRRPA